MRATPVFQFLGNLRVGGAHGGLDSSEETPLLLPVDGVLEGPMHRIFYLSRDDDICPMCVTSVSVLCGCGVI